MTVFRQCRPGQADGEARARAFGAGDGQPAAVAVDDVLDDGEAEARAQPVARLLALDAVETLGQTRQVLAPDARPLVAHRDARIPVVKVAVGPRTSEIHSASSAAFETVAERHTNRTSGGAWMITSSHTGPRYGSCR